MKVATTLVVLLVILGCSLNVYGQSQKFTANCQVGNYSKPSAGLTACSFSYDWTQLSYLDVEGQNSILYQFNQWRGEDQTQVDPYVNQYSFKSGPGCPGGCETGRVYHSMPRLWLDTTTYKLVGSDNTVTYNGAACYKYTPITSPTLSTVTNIWFTSQTASSAQICSFQMADGTYYLFSNVNNNPTFASNTFTSPSGCTCSKPIDIALVLDRSGSISVGEFQQQLSFIRGFFNSFTFSTTKANMGIVNFNTKAWGVYVPPANRQQAYYTQPPALPLSNNPQNINATINGLTCCTGNTNADSVCCNGFTAISSGVRAGVDILAASTRSATAAQIIVLLTDGKQNTLYHPNSDAYNDCYYQDANGNNLCCNYAVGSNCPDGVYYPKSSVNYPGAQYLYCLGDSNYDGIVDAWQGGAVGTVSGAWSCGVCNRNQGNCGCAGTATCCKSGYDKQGSCNGTYCSTDSQYLKNRLAVCHQDLIDAREYGFTKNKNMIFYSVGVGSEVSTTELGIVSNNIYKRPANVNPVSPVGSAWTPVYRTSDNTNPERVLTASDWSKLSGLLLTLTTQICDEPATPCGDCCGVCQCGTCVYPPVGSAQCPQTTNKCILTQVLAAGTCCVNTTVTCPPKPCQDAVCDPAQGCVYTARVCPDNGCYSFACNVTTNACYQSAPKWKPADNPCFVSGCNTQTMTIYQNQPISPPCSAQNTACTTYSCNNGTGLCVATPVPPTTPAPNKCQTRTCDPVNGWQQPVNNPCNPINKCNTAACDLGSGQCVQTPITCRNASDLCDLGTCDLNTGNCIPNRKTCPVQDLCVGAGTCDATTGNCVYPPRKTCVSQNCHPWACNSTSGACQSTDPTPCTGICSSANCGTATGVDACHTRYCVTTDPNNNCNGWINNTCATENSTNTDTCIVGYYCDNTKGCLSIPVPECAAPPPCFTLSRNSSYPGCCQYIPKNCDLGDPCFNYDCNTTSNACEYIPKCPASSPCYNRGCSSENGTCWETPVCSHKPCFIDLPCVDDPTAANAGCQSTVNTCDDKNACTIDSCSNDVCTNAPRDCNGTDLCLIYSCDPSTGCTSVPRVCDDGIACTVDTCNSTVGCIFTPDDSYCDDANLCTNDTCSVTAGCQNIYIVCEGDGNDCEEPVCRKNYGCQNDQVVCYLNGTGEPIRAVDYDGAAYNNMTDDERQAAKDQQNQQIQAASDQLRNNNDCDYAVCANNTCVKKQLACAAFDVTAVIAGTVTAGAIAGIVIACVAALLLGGGGAYYVANNAGLGGDASVNSNPLYQPQGVDQANPLHEAGDA